MTPTFDHTADAAATIYLVSQSVDRLSEGRRLASAVVSTCDADMSKTTRGIHPDVLELTPPEGKERIGINQVREIIRAAQFAPVQSECKVCLIPKAEGLTVEAANALLKILEEPPRGLRFILLAEHPSDLLPTIVSRSRLIRMTSASASQATERLVNAQYTGDQAQWIARLSLRNGELDTLLQTRVDLDALLAATATQLRHAEMAPLIDAALGDAPVLRRQAHLSLLSKMASCDGTLLTTGVRMLAAQPREVVAQFLRDLLAVTYDIVRTASMETSVKDSLATQVLESVGIRPLHAMCFALDDAHRALAVYGPIEGILLSLFLTFEGETHGI